MYLSMYGGRVEERENFLPLAWENLAARSVWGYLSTSAHIPVELCGVAGVPNELVFGRRPHSYLPRH